MTDTRPDLTTRFTERADRAPDLADVLTAARARSELMRQHRRGRLAAGASALAVVALAGGVALAANAGHSRRSNDTGAVGSSERDRVGLVRVTPAPKQYELSFEYVPAAWVLLKPPAHNGSAIEYGPAGSDGSQLLTNLVAFVADSTEPDPTGRPMVVAGHAGTYDEAQGSYSACTAWTSTTTVCVQAPPRAELTTAQFATIAATLQVRSIERTG